MKATLTNQLKLTQIPEEIREELIQRFQLPNPKYVDNQRMGRWNKGVPKVLRYYHRVGADGLVVPRGFMRQLILMCRGKEVPLDIIDRRRRLSDVDLAFHGSLKPFQQRAVAIDYPARPAFLHRLRGGA